MRVSATVGVIVGEGIGGLGVGVLVGVAVGVSVGVMGGVGAGTGRSDWPSFVGKAIGEEVGGGGLTAGVGWSIALGELSPWRKKGVAVEIAVGLPKGPRGSPVHLGVGRRG